MLAFLSNFADAKEKIIFGRCESMPTLKNKTVVITGGSSGIGAKAGLYAAQRGALPVLLARTEEKLKEMQKMIGEYSGTSPLIHPLDVSDAEAVDQLFDQITEETNGIDVLVNNAGFGIFDLFHEARLKDLKSMLDVNVFGLMACTRKVLPQMMERNSGHIVNVASLAGKVSTPKSTAYSATKHAVIGFSNGLRMELAGTNVNVTTVNPGPVNTNFFNIADESGEYLKNVSKFMLEPDEIARKIVDALEKPRREINVPFSMSAGSKMFQMFPGTMEKVMGRFMNLK